jgi:hypothetical protein
MTRPIMFRSYGAVQLLRGPLSIKISSLWDDDRFPAGCLIVAYKGNALTEQYRREMTIAALIFRVLAFRRLGTRPQPPAQFDGYEN